MHISKSTRGPKADEAIAHTARLFLVSVGELRIYPIKSLRGISVMAAELQPRGFEDDRRMMIVDANGRFVSQREHAGLALIGVQQNATGWTVTAPNHSDLHIDATASLESIEVTVWRDT